MLFDICDFCVFTAFSRQCRSSPQSFSSDRSPQSSLKSQTWLGSIHALLLHMNVFSEHDWGSTKEIQNFEVNRNLIKINWIKALNKLVAYQERSSW